jgi:hypothetical protein
MLLMIGLTSLPYFLAATSAPAGARFSGVLSNPVDFNSHLAKMQQGWRGDWRYSLLFTSEPHDAVFLQTFYVALGHVARLTGGALEGVYHGARVLFTALMVWALWAFLRHYLPPRQAWWALLLTLFSGGLGFLLYFFAPALAREVAPIELWLSDGYTFLAAYSFPHFAVGIAMLASALLLVERWTRGKPGSLLALLLVTLGIGIVQPFGLPLVDLILVIGVGWRVLRGQMRLVNAVRGLFLVGVAHAALLGYSFVVLYGFPVWRDFTAQNITLSPLPIYYGLGYAPLLFPALGGLALIVRRREGRWLLPITWLLLVVLLLYAPLNTQRRYTLAIQAPLAALAVYWAAEAGLPALRRRLRGRATLVLILYAALSSTSTLLFVQAQIAQVADHADPTVYTSADMQAAWQWVRDNTSPSDVFLAAFESGGQIAGQTGRRVMLGHWIETIHFLRKREQVRQFFDPATPDEQRAALLRDQHITYVWYGPFEHDLVEGAPGAWSPANSPAFSPVFEGATITIYRVLLRDS